MPANIQSNFFVNPTQRPNASSRYCITCNFNKPVQRPLEVLKELAEAIIKEKATSIKVIYIDQSGFDLGGLSSDLMYRLFKTLSVHYELRECIAPWSEENRRVFSDIGAVFKMLIGNGWRVRPNDTALTPLGEAFQLGYFGGLLAFNYEEVRGNFEAISDLRIFKILVQSASGHKRTFLNAVASFLEWDGSAAGSQHHIDTMIVAKKVMNVELPAGALNDKSVFDIKLLADVKRAILAVIIQDEKGRVRTLHTIAKAMDCSRQIWGNLQRQTPETFQDYVQGRFSKEALKSSFRFFLV